MNALDSHFSPRYEAVGESALLLEIAEEITSAANVLIRAVDIRMGETLIPGVVEWIPAYTSLLVIFDPFVIQSSEVRQWIDKCLATAEVNVHGKDHCIQIPVRYGGENGPDLAFISAYHHLSPSEVVSRHVQGIYRVAMMGFTPGFAYLFGMDPGLTAPRRETPRIHVPAGSVGIAGTQTGIYPLDSPGGWQLIGRTEAAMFIPEQEPPFLLSPGDVVRFIAIEDGVVS